jgi:hypothetical protein
LQVITTNEFQETVARQARDAGGFAIGIGTELGIEHLVGVIDDELPTLLC